jgi:quercetin dioxygenase-like cupin family protein
LQEVCYSVFKINYKLLKIKIMKKKKSLLVTGIAAVGLAALTINSSAVAQQSEILRTDLQRHDLSIPGHEVVQATVEFLPGAEAVEHTHPGEEIIYVLEGLLEYQVEGRPPTTLKAGEVLLIPAGTVHSAKNVGTGNATELATYVVEKGKPLISLVK